MKEAFEKIIERLEEEKSDWNDDYNVPINRAIEIVNQVAEKCKDRIFINGQCCWQSCACTEKCQECNRYTLSDSDIDWYESIEDWNEEFGGDINVGSKWIPCSEGLPEESGWYLISEGNMVTVACYIEKLCEWEDVIEGYYGYEPKAWQPLPAPYKPKGE